MSTNTLAHLSRPTSHQSLHFHLLYLAGLAVTLPVVATLRLFALNGDEGVFQKTHRAVLTALEVAFTA
jgi:hypothetical protein